MSEALQTDEEVRKGEVRSGGFVCVPSVVASFPARWFQIPSREAWWTSSGCFMLIWKYGEQWWTAESWSQLSATTSAQRMCQVPLNIFVVIGTKLTDVYPQLGLSCEALQADTRCLKRFHFPALCCGRTQASEDSFQGDWVTHCAVR